jgi:hypothetical protein
MPAIEKKGARRGPAFFATSFTAALVFDRGGDFCWQASGLFAGVASVAMVG